jgi:superfamily II DNA or RNA helicase
MTLVNKLISFVSSRIRSRASAYLRRVKIQSAAEGTVKATVRGSRLYNVSLRCSDEEFQVYCSCPYFEGSGLCKHIWAAIVMADASRLFPASLTDKIHYLIEVEDPDSEAVSGSSARNGTQELSSETGRALALKRQAAPASPPPPDWKKQLASLRTRIEHTNPARPSAWPAGRELVYLLDLPAATQTGNLFLEFGYRDRKRNGEWRNPRLRQNLRVEPGDFSDPLDREILSRVLGCENTDYYYSSYRTSGPALSGRVKVSPWLFDVLIPLLAKSGRAFARAQPDHGVLQPLSWDDGPPWEFWAQVRKTDGRYALGGELRRGEERMPLSAPRQMFLGGLLLLEDRFARFDDRGAFAWIVGLRNSGPVSAPAGQADQLLTSLLDMPTLPRLDLPEELRYEEVTLAPRPRLHVRPKKQHSYVRHQERLAGELSFDYEGTVITPEQHGSGFYEQDRRRLVRRDRSAEANAAERLRQLGFRPFREYYTQESGLELTPRNLPSVVTTLLREGWHVEAEGKLYRQPSAFKMEVTSGIDWFELHGDVEFGDAQIPLPRLLAALRRGENSVLLDDGTFGMIPEEWLKKYGVLAGVGQAEEEMIRFSRAQVGLLDALLATMPEATCDELFQQARDELRHFVGIKPRDPAAGFTGRLRGYQREGLGWFDFLQRFNFGGCLADDMGLGKTVQVLALLEERRQARAAAPKRKRSGPALVVVPKSLIFNWKQEAARFAPELRVLDHTGGDRTKGVEHFDDYDLVLTTYGTLRRDAVDFKDAEFDYCILDESQAIKNAGTESAKAVRLLRARHRLALSGTPIENHLGELWSLFEFLNPGMLGAASVFKMTAAGGRQVTPETRELLAKALRPFILRRTKDQVAKDLPQKLEQTLYCELEPVQRKMYNELRDHYRQSLLQKVQAEGINKAKILIIEALLRLRQAACHPGLVDKSQIPEPSAKLDVLLPQLAEVMEEGHKALVFSQFTSLLSIVRSRLDEAEIRYEYLDGKTRDRAARVERFQKDPECKLFLISLKAGGLGLNLTAAEYVFLLDPWWNPAVEAQAIDRAHRIGQTKSVFAYRLIAKDTVEEKVLELQKTKRDLADAIINADNSLIRRLAREDLELLLS